MIVDAGGGKLNNLKWPKAIKKVNKQAHQKILKKLNKM